MKIAITGANGYIGKSLVKSALQQGFKVNALVRNKAACCDKDGLNFFHYDLDSIPDSRSFEMVDALIHLATVTNSQISNQKVIDLELFALKNLLEEVQKNGIKNFIFISSQSASKNSPTNYGYRKYLLEEEVLKNNGIVVRPGLVYGEEEHALFGTFCKLAKILPILPEFLPKIYVQPVHVEDLSKVLLSLVISGQKKSQHNIAQRNPIAITEFLQNLAWYKFWRHLILIPLPHLFLRFAGFIKIIDPERVNGLLALRVMKVDENFNLRNLKDGLQSGELVSRKRLLLEGKALMQYVSGAKHNKFFAKKYVKAMTSAEPLRISKIYLSCPVLLRLIDPRSPIFLQKFANKNELDRRLKLALIIAESDSKASSQFIPFKEIGLVKATLKIVLMMSFEFLLIFMGIITKFLRNLKSAA